MFGVERKQEKAVSNAEYLQIRAELAKVFISFEFKIFSTIMSSERVDFVQSSNN
jgi:hypothetical protein